MDAPKWLSVQNSEPKTKQWKQGDSTTEHQMEAQNKQKDGPQDRNTKWKLQAKGKMDSKIETPSVDPDQKMDGWNLEVM